MENPFAFDTYKKSNFEFIQPRKPAWMNEDLDLHCIRKTNGWKLTYVDTS